MSIQKEREKCLEIIQALDNSFRNAKEETILPVFFFTENNRRIYELKKAINRLEELQFESKEYKKKSEPVDASLEREISSGEFVVDKIGKKIFSDIQSCLSLNDRFRFQRDLFLNDSDLMNQTLNHLNKSESFEEIMDYLDSRFAWDWENESATAFKEILRIKFS